MDKVMPDMIAAVEDYIGPMPDDMAELMPDLLPKTMESLMPTYLPQLIPHVTPLMIDYIRAAVSRHRGEAGRRGYSRPRTLNSAPAGTPNTSLHLSVPQHIETDTHGEASSLIPAVRRRFRSRIIESVAAMLRLRRYP
jgi:hypothetical protein